MKNHPVVEITGDNRTTVDYRTSMSEDGPMYYTWADKPHRFVYDLCSEIERRADIEIALRKQIECLVAHLIMVTGNGGQS